MRARVLVLLAAIPLLAYVTAGVGSAVTVEVAAIEGHTVFVSVTNVTDEGTGHAGPAAAVAVLVREHEAPFASRFPGVLWFNDQYLVDPASMSGPGESVRYPCTGAAIAVEAGQPDPREGVALTGHARYTESYRITDPNDVQWDVDRWIVSSEIDGHEYFVWTVALRSSGTEMDVFDAETSCEPVMDRGCPLPLDATGCYRQRAGADPTQTPAAPSKACVPPHCGTLRYNALLFIFLDDLQNSGAPKDHTNKSSSPDVPGCHEDDEELGCPEGDDAREGDSHPVFDPLQMWEQDGATADCDGDGRHDRHCHRTAAIDVYYGTAPVPEERHYVLYDIEGSAESLGCSEISAALGVCLP